MDIGCGSGRAINLMAHAFPSSRFTGYDLSAEGIANAKKEAATKKLDNAHFDVKDVTNLDKREEYDLTTAFDAIHDQARPAKVLRGIADALKPDGVLCRILQALALFRIIFLTLSDRFATRFLGCIA